MQTLIEALKDIITEKISFSQYLSQKIKLEIMSNIHNFKTLEEKCKNIVSCYNDNVFKEIVFGYKNPLDSCLNISVFFCFLVKST